MPSAWALLIQATPEDGPSWVDVLGLGLAAVVALGVIGGGALRVASTVRARRASLVAAVGVDVVAGTRGPVLVIFNDGPAVARDVRVSFTDGELGGPASLFFEGVEPVFPIAMLAPGGTGFRYPLLVALRAGHHQVNATVEWRDDRGDELQRRDMALSTRGAQPPVDGG